ncbi:MAG: immunity protein 19 [Prevotellaceae bacterium]|jgi:hypothetical protein|nr:immunity protein 19 [Prevotellaceae bacterium]
MLQLNPADTGFWRFYIAYSFPFATDDNTETSIDEFICGHYDLPDEKWYHDLVGTTEDGEEKEPWTGTTINIKLNKEVVFGVEFHAIENTYFFNKINIGNTGGNFVLSLLSWQEFKNIVRGEKNNHIFLLMLPLVAGNSYERDEIFAEISKRISISPLQLKTEDIPVVANYLVNHLILDKDDVFGNDDKLGIVCKRAHSRRSADSQLNTPEEIVEINRLIRLAQS